LLDLFSIGGDWGFPQQEKYRYSPESYIGIFAFVYTNALLAKEINGKK